jgi:hypothetical protein
MSTTAAETRPVAGAPPKVSFATIDSALQSGLRDPRERVALLRLEQALLDFMTSYSSVGWMEVGGPANSWVLFPNKSPPPVDTAAPLYQSSFHRLLVHRLADRFAIVREKGLILEGSLRLIKVPSSKVPETLLRDLDPAEYAVQPTPSPSSSPSPGASPLASKPDSGGGAKPRKFKIMKRQSSQPMGHGAGGSASKQEARRLSSESDLESREKAYAEARARIFSDGSAELPASASSQNLAADASLAASGHGLAQQVATRLSVSESGNSTPPIVPSQVSTEASTPCANGASAVEQPRAVYRNRFEEAADPDFQRGTGTVVFQPSSVPYGTSASSHHYGYAGVVPGAAMGARAPNNLTASARVFYPQGGVPYAAYPTGGWQPASVPMSQQAIPRSAPSRADQER